MTDLPLPEPVPSFRACKISKCVQECLNTEQDDGDARSFAEWVAASVVDTLNRTEASLWAAGFRSGVLSAMRTVERNMISQSTGIAGRPPEGLASQVLLGIQAQLNGLRGSITESGEYHALTADQMHAYAAAKTAELEAECAMLRALIDAHNASLSIRGWGCNHIDAALRGKETK